jgi:23S rRNA pseudouridine2605 synthase
MKAVIRTDSRRVGLARALSKLGYCSRTRAAILVRAGRVRLNRAVRRDPKAPVHLNRDQIQVDGQDVESAARVYLMLNKPRGVVTTASDELGRKTVYDCVEPSLRVAPVGRLDKASEGLLLLSNDSEWGASIQAPETHLEKTYHVQIGAVADSAMLASIERGVKTEVGVLRTKSAGFLRGGKKNSWLEIVLDEGKNRQIRRIFDALGIGVLRLVRIAIGPLVLGDLARGESRRLTPEEKQSLDLAMKKSGRR